METEPKYTGSLDDLAQYIDGLNYNLTHVAVGCDVLLSRLEQLSQLVRDNDTYYSFREALPDDLFDLRQEASQMLSEVLAGDQDEESLGGTDE